ncbi:hypothetical protein C8034_v006228 [Colletotrichum sidae]|uniref:Apple domain-containing protein n=1 Tax=Colletotrichum sidae TaxID=1347389 RepID=A0A4R8T4W6_9PEZI|nr:hypothetical protein C8034_v006228 [Colletotrichum sidae]
MEDNLKFTPSVKEKVLGMFKTNPPADSPSTAKPPPSSDHHEQQQHQSPQHYESGLEVAHPLPWTPQDIALPELAPYNHVDAKTISTPQVADAQSPWSWPHDHKKGGFLTDASSAPEPVVTPGGYSVSSSTGLANPYYQQHPAGYHHPPPSSSTPPLPLPKTPSGERRKCGLRRRTFYIIMAVVLVFVVAAIAIGLGAGLAFAGRRKDGSSSGSSGFVPPSNPPFPPFGAGDFETTKTANITCPKSDNTTFAAQDNPARHFRFICGHDYNSGEGSIDLAQQNTTTTAACIDLCAAKSECVGAGWGDYYGNHVCWMKSKLGRPNVSGNWYFAVDLNGTNASSLP